MCAVLPQGCNGNPPEYGHGVIEHPATEAGGVFGGKQKRYIQMDRIKPHAWSTQANSTGEKTLSQHCFVSKECGDWWNRYEGNISLCGKITVVNENNDSVKLKNIIQEKISDRCCKKCLKIWIG